MTTLLTERISPIVYHWTMPDNAVSILDQQKFQLSNTFNRHSELKATDHIKKNIKYFYMSVARSPTSSYIKNRSEGVLFELNGEWFNRHHSSVPFDYWYSAGSKPDTKGREYEDRILSDNPYIDISGGKAVDAIRGIHILIFSYHLVENSIKVYAKALKLGVPVFMYKDVKDWLTRNKSKALDKNEIIKLSKALVDLKTRNPDTNTLMKKASWLVPFGRKPSWLDDRKLKDRIITFKSYYDSSYTWRELYHKNKVEELSVPSYQLLSKLIDYGMSSMYELTDRLLGAIQGQNKGNADLIRILKKIGAEREHEKYIRWLMDKWRNPWNKYKENMEKKNPYSSLKEELLTEKISDVVYHYTRAKPALDILKNRHFLLSSASGHKIEVSGIETKTKLKPYYMSVARSPLSDYFRKSSEGVLFILNGRWLNGRYAGGAFNFFKNDGTGGQKDDEMEDRLYSTTPDIPFPANALDLIKEIHINIGHFERAYQENLRFKKASVSSSTMYDYYNAIDLMTLKTNLQVYKLGKNMGIPCYLYEKNAYWLTRNKSKAITMDRMKEILSFLNDKYDPYKAKYGPESEKIALKSVPFDMSQTKYDAFSGIRKVIKNRKSFRTSTRSPGHDPLFLWRELYYTRASAANIETLSDRAKEIAKDMSYMASGMMADSSKEQMIHSLVNEFNEALIQNRTHKDKDPVESLRKMHGIFRDLGIRNTKTAPKEFVTYLINKWNVIRYEDIKNVSESPIPNVYHVYHGSNAKFKEFTDKTKRIPNDYYGGGLAYFTDDKKVALTYSKAMTARYGGEETLYAVNLTLRNFFDVDKKFTGNELKAFFSYIKPEEFARGAGLLKAGMDKYTILARLDNGTMEISGKDVFKGLSSGMVNTSRAQDILKKMGYDGLRYNGGDNMGSSHHNVFLPYYSSAIKISNTFKVNRQVIKEETQIPPIGHMSYPRDMLPQIKNQDEFLEYIINLFDISVERVSPLALKATQLDGFDIEKIKQIQKIKKLDPIIASSRDMHILDGHHRWAAAWNNMTDIDVYFVDAPIIELIRVAASFYKSKNEDEWLSEEYDMPLDLEESLNYQVLYHKMDSSKLLNCLRTNKLEGRWVHTLPDISFKDPYGNKFTETLPYNKRKDVTGTSLTRNKNLDFEGLTYKFGFELDRKKIRDTNKLHVIDADLIHSGINPYASNTENRTRLMYMNKGKFTQKRHPEFAEEFVEGDLYPLHKYLRSIMIDSKTVQAAASVFLSKFESELLSPLVDYSIRYNIPLKYMDTGKDATEDLIDMIHNKVTLTPKLDITRTIVNMKNSINKGNAL